MYSSNRLNQYSERIYPLNMMDVGLGVDQTIGDTSGIYDVNYQVLRYKISCLFYNSNLQ